MEDDDNFIWSDCSYLLEEPREWSGPAPSCRRAWRHSRLASGSWCSIPPRVYKRTQCWGHPDLDQSLKLSWPQDPRHSPCLARTLWSWLSIKSWWLFSMSLFTLPAVTEPVIKNNIHIIPEYIITSNVTYSSLLVTNCWYVTHDNTAPGHGSWHWFGQTWESSTFHCFNINIVVFKARCVICVNLSPRICLVKS